jgi:3-dehydroquinate dehydratase-2
MKFLVINGPNMNRLGLRDKAQYGAMTLAQLNKYIRETCKERGDKVRFFQSNSEGKIVTALHRAENRFNAVILNAAAYTHYSYAIRDAVECISVPVCEVHMSDVASREEFRRFSVLQGVAVLTVSGLREKSYTEAMRLFKEQTP